VNGLLIEEIPNLEEMDPFRDPTKRREDGTLPNFVHGWQSLEKLQPIFL